MVIIFGFSFPYAFLAFISLPVILVVQTISAKYGSVVSVPWNRGDPFEAQLVKFSGMKTGRQKGSTFLPSGSGNGLTGTGTM